MVISRRRDQQKHIEQNMAKVHVQNENANQNTNANSIGHGDINIKYAGPGQGSAEIEMTAMTVNNSEAAANINIMDTPSITVLRAGSFPIIPLSLDFQAVPALRSHTHLNLSRSTIYSNGSYRPSIAYPSRLQLMSSDSQATIHETYESDLISYMHPYNQDSQYAYPHHHIPMYSSVHEHGIAVPEQIDLYGLNDGMEEKHAQNDHDHELEDINLDLGEPETPLQGSVNVPEMANIDSCSLPKLQYLDSDIQNDTYEKSVTPRTPHDGDV